jgi:hypothetical protein
VTCFAGAHDGCGGAIAALRVMIDGFARFLSTSASLNGGAVATMQRLGAIDSDRRHRAGEKEE